MIDKPWETLGPGDGDPYVQVHPLYDSRDHVLVGNNCWCKPKVERYRLDVVIHNAADGREFAERAGPIALSSRN